MTESDGKAARVGSGVWQLGSSMVALDPHVDALRSALFADTAAPSGLLVLGEAGSGKSAAVRQLLRQLRMDDWFVAVHIGQWTPMRLFHAVAEAIHLSDSDDPAVHDAFAVLNSTAGGSDKLRVVCELLADSPLVLVFDDLSQNLNHDGRFVDPGFAAVFDQLCRAAGRGRIVATSWRSPSDEVWLRPYPFDWTTSDALELAARLPEVGALGPTERAQLVVLLARRPRLLLLADVWLYEGGVAHYQRLLAAGAEVFLSSAAAGPDGPEPDGPEPPAQTQAQPQALRTALLGLILELLTPAQRELLLQASLSTLPLTMRDLASLRGTAHRTREEWLSPDPATVEATVQDASRLIGLGLAVGVSDDELYVEPWTADGLRTFHGFGALGRHELAILLHHHRLTSELKSFLDIVSITRHGAAEPGLVDVARLAAGVVTRQGDLNAAALLGEVIPAVPADHPLRPELVRHHADRLRECGFADAASHISHSH